MHFKCCSFIIIVLNQNFANGFGFYDISNTFYRINKELDDTAPFLEYSSIKTRWIEQELDHFDSKELRTWKMRYFERLDFWRLNGPIFLFLGGESPVSSNWASTGIMYELAKETSGAVYVSEHRYYGKSKPFNTTNTKHFKYLSSIQALADIAKLLKTIKLRKMFKNSKVVVVGGSYSGNLAAWMRLLYPDLVDAAIASSGPVLAKKDFYEYLEKVNDNYEQYGTSDCLDKIRNMFSRYDEMMRSSKGIEQLKIEENICEECDFTVAENQQFFFMYKTYEFMYNSQYGNTKAIEGHCKNLNKGLSSKEIERSMKPKSRLSKIGCNCYDFEEIMEEYHDNENDWILAWVYQTCTEFGYFQTTSSASQPFTNNIDVSLYTKICESLFGEEFDEVRVDIGVKKANELYQGLRPNVTNVVFTNGDLDPWSTLGILEDLSYNAPAVIIPRASHCQDLFSNKDDDIEELKEARKLIKYLIKNWIGAEGYLSSK